MSYDPVAILPWYWHLPSAQVALSLLAVGLAALAWRKSLMARSLRHEGYIQDLTTELAQAQAERVALVIRIETLEAQLAQAQQHIARLLRGGVP